MQKRIRFFDGYTSEITPSDTVVVTETVAITNNTTIWTDIIGLVFDQANYKSFIVNYVVNRQTDTALSGLTEIGEFTGTFNQRLADWVFSQVSTGDHSGVEFYITPSGQFQFKSNNMSGSNYLGEMTFVISKTF